MSGNEMHGHGVLAVWNDVDPDHEAEYHRWYWEQHLPERLAVPGFRSAYRYQAVDGRPKFFTWYFVREVEVLRSQAYLARLSNPTDWTQRVMPWFRSMMRCACRMSLDFGAGIGGALAVIRLSGAGAPDRELRARLAREMLPPLLSAESESAATRAQLWETDREISVQRTAEHTLRAEPDRIIDSAIVLHCPAVDLARVAGTKLQKGVLHAHPGLALDGPYIYTLMHCLSADA